MTSFPWDLITHSLSLAADLATILTVLFAILPFVKALKTQQAASLKRAYENLSEQRWAVINNTKALQIVAEDYGVTPEQFIRDTIASDRINTVAWQFEFHLQRLTDPDLWNHQILDIQGLFALPFIVERWSKVRSQYDQEFQHFIDNQILSDPPNTNTQSNETTSSTRHPQL